MATVDVCLFLEPGNGLGMHCSLRQLQNKNAKQNIMTNISNKIVLLHQAHVVFGKTLG